MTGFLIGLGFTYLVLQLESIVFRVEGPTIYSASIGLGGSVLLAWLL